ncbi:BLUF domain-containing protein [Marinicella meishanensis]|uniref:BLUF domain-containing protein n=1 Tax=Marinicella meishanensis TaxID=2873263 RepID=UPI001CBDEBF3|nr:BLUF domain-containing protein [Marinicella sp. NBU2979]
MNNNQSLVRLTYASIKDRHVDGRDLEQILIQAQAHNEQRNITGVLVFNSQFFLQALEGPRVAVSQLYNKIIQDTRHHDAQIIKLCAIKQRHWSVWSMEFISISEPEERVYRKYSSQSQFNPFKIETDAVDDFLQEICQPYLEGS